MRLALTLIALTLSACDAPPAPAGGQTPAATTKAPASQPTKPMDHGGITAEFQPLQGATVAFAEPVEGATVTSPFKVKMTVTGATVQAAGVPAKGTGHHHILVDTEPSAAGTTVAKDATHIHYGDGSTEAELTLAPGAHTLTLQFADGMHRSYGPGVSQTIHITVAK